MMLVRNARLSAIADRTLLFLAVAPLLLTVSWATTFEWSDNGLTLMSGDSLLRGEMPYRDFHWHYLPGAPALVFLIEKLFGHSYLAVRMFFVLAVILTVVLSLFLIRRLTGRISGWIAFAVLLPTVSWRPLLSHAVLEPLAGVGTVLLVIQATENPRSWRWLLAGLPAAGLLFFNHLAGPVLIVGAIIGLIIRHASLAPEERPSWSPVLQWGALLVVPTVVSLLGLFVWSVLTGTTGEIIDWAGMRLANRYVANNSGTNILDLEPVRRSTTSAAVLVGEIVTRIRTFRIYALSIAMRCLPLVSVAFVSWFILKSRPTRAPETARIRNLSIALGVGFALYLESFKGWKQGANDLAALVAIMALWSAVSVYRARGVRLALTAVALIVSGVSLTFMAGQVLAATRMSRMAVLRTPLGNIRSMNVEDADFRKRLFDAIRAHPEARTLFSYYYDPGIYPMTGLQPITPYRYFTLTLTGRPDFRAACADIRRNPPDLVLRDTDWDTRPGAPVGKELEECVAEMYVVEREIPSVSPGHPYRLMVRRGR